MKTLKRLFLDGLAEIYDSEARLVWSMPKMAAAATCKHLQEAVENHLKETESHVIKLQRVFQSVGERARRKTSESIIALLNESHHALYFFEGFPALNAALIANLQKVEHYEIASYGCLRDWATVLGYNEAAETLQSILDENKVTNQSLTDLARTRSNQQALSEQAVEVNKTAGADQDLVTAIAQLETEAPVHGAPRTAAESRIDIAYSRSADKETGPTVHTSESV